MTPEQVVKIWKQPLSKPVQSKKDKAMWWVTAPDTQVGEWLARVEFTFRERDTKQLVAIMLRLPVTSDHMRVCDELATTYGPPTSTGEMTT
jgi:hypothetical protein